MHQFLHEPDLIETSLEKEAREGRKRLFAQRAPAVQIIAARRIAGCEVRLVIVFASRESTRHRPDAARAECFEQDGMRHQPRHAAVPVQKRVNPKQPVVSGGGGENRFRPSQCAVDVFKTSKKTRDSSRTDRDVASNLHVPVAQFARHDSTLFAAIRVVDFQEFRRQQLAEPPVDLDDPLCADRTSRQPPAVNPSLHRYVRLGLKLQVALPRVRTGRFGT